MTLQRSFKHPYAWFCAFAILAWLIAWLSIFPNLYGWLIDDSQTFDRIRQFERGGQYFFDIIWFHAYMWLLMVLPWKLHWAVPSHVAARSYALTGQFRALILYTIFLQGLFLALLAWFLRTLCGSRAVCAIAFVLFLLSPTFELYVPLLDSRYLGYLAAIPAMILMLRQVSNIATPVVTQLCTFFVSGFLLAVGEDIHYECLYLTFPFTVVYWTLLLLTRRPSRVLFAGFTCFVLGALAWVLPIQVISLHYHPFVDSFFGISLRQHSEHLSPYPWHDDLVTWGRLFLSEMGIPMILATLAGAVILVTRRLRPSYFSPFNAQLIVGSSVLLSIFIVFSRTFPFYRVTSGMQIFFMLMAVTAIERGSLWIFPLSPKRRYSLAAALLLCIAFVPAMLRTPEVFSAQQGYGKAVNLAYRLAGDGHVHFIDTFDNESRPPAVDSRVQLNDLKPNDYLVTYFPVVFHFKYPDIFALLYDVKPVASYPTLWCTKEMWAQIPTFFGTRRWFDEPPNCEAQVFSVADIRKAENKPALIITSVSADSSEKPTMTPDHAFLPRNPSLGIHDHQALWIPDYQNLWTSNSNPGEHWLQVSFANQVRISAVTIVPPEFRVPPDFLWTGRERIDNLRIYGAPSNSAPFRMLWSAVHLRRRVIFTARFAEAHVTRLRFVMLQYGPPANHAVGITYVRFPEYRQVLELSEYRAANR
jgi:hypothetical protein